MEKTKRCAKCKGDKPLSDFNKCNKRKDGLRSYCKVCYSLRNIQYRNNHPKRYKDRRLKQNYGISLYDYNLLFLKQEGKCAICSTHQKDLKSNLGVDHNHKTNKVRGLLCFNCNMGIGYLKDNIKTLSKAISYLKS